MSTLQEQEAKDVAQFHKDKIEAVAKKVARKRQLANAAIADKIKAHELMEKTAEAKAYRATDAVAAETAQVAGEAEQELRRALVEAFETTGEKVYDDVGTVKEYANVEIDEFNAIAWVISHDLWQRNYGLLKISISKNALKKTIEALNLDWMVKAGPPTVSAAISKDLSHLLEDQNE